MKDLAFHFDEPFADSSAVPTYYVSKLARQKVTVALSGDGGDENFAGYEKYYIDDIENRFRSLIPRFVRHYFHPYFTGLLWDTNSVLLRKGSTLLKTLAYEADHGFYLTNTEFDDRLWEKTILDHVKKKINGYDPSHVTKDFYSKADTDNHISRILYTDLKTYLVGDILVKVDRMSMAHSLEVRAPILDHHVIEFASSIPAHLKYNRGEKKYILKKTFNKILPPEIMYRKKMGFSVPLADWMRGELKAVTHASVFAPNAGIAQLFDRVEIQKLWDLHQAGARNYATILWSLLMFEMWFQEFMA